MRTEILAITSVVVGLVGLGMSLGVLIMSSLYTCVPM